MKKIMFKDEYGLTQAVLEGKKTMTRRIMNPQPTWVNGDGHIFNDSKPPKYKVGEVLAVAQSYEQAGWKADTLQQTFVKKPTIFPDLDKYQSLRGWVDLPLKYHKGWTNKMFVLADLMPHQIRITNVHIERLQDISDEDCLREGIWKDEHGGKIIGYPIGVPFFYTFDGAVNEKRDGLLHWTTPREAFAALIDKVSGKGTWENNPYVFVYEFELLK